jgi:hypothetical protein
MVASTSTSSNEVFVAEQKSPHSDVAPAFANLATLALPALILGAAGFAVALRRLDRRRAPLASEAARVLVACRSTTYSYEPLVDAGRGIYDVDCSAFVGLLLENVAPTLFARIPRAPGERYPRAFEFYDFLASPQPEWRLVPKLAAVRRGDVICWRLPGTGAGDTGHVMVVARAPIFDAKLQTWSARVYDSSSIPHFDDSRDSGGTYHSGVGSGSLRFRADAMGRAVQFQFGPGDGFHAHPILVARFDPRVVQR